MSRFSLGRAAAVLAGAAVVLFLLSSVGQGNGFLWPDGPEVIGAIGWFGWMLCVLLLLVLGLVALVWRVSGRRTKPV